MQKLTFNLFIYLVLLTSISAMPSIWPSNIALTQEEKSTCTQFKILQGSNRINEFKKIEQVFNRHKMISTKFTSNDIQKILGNPNEKTANGNWIYNLNPDQPNCKAIFNCDGKTYVIQ